jgi:hypothetical protein
MNPQQRLEDAQSTTRLVIELTRGSDLLDKHSALTQNCKRTLTHLYIGWRNDRKLSESTAIDVGCGQQIADRVERCPM